ncbi:MAG: hypothetical protein KAX39_04740 [candidate division Zixibacteria bacterium]|nr:hypothetical protein [candidate division Zixibacteria bacterium]
MDPKELFLEPLKSTGEKIINLLPSLVGALVILLLGWLVAKILKAALIKLLVAMRFEKFGERSGLSKFLSRGDIKHSLADILGTVFFWIIFLFFIYIAADVLKLSLISDLINRIISFIPNLIAAVLIIIIGVLLSSFFKGMVKVAATSYDLAHRELLGKIVQYLIIFFAVAMSLEELGVATHILVNSVLIIIGAMAFGFALAFGLGSKDVAGKIVNKILESEKTRGVSSGEISNPSEKENPNQTNDRN